MDTDVAQMMATLARLEEKIDALVGLPNRVDSLETTRDRQRGAAKFAARLGCVCIVQYPAKLI